MSESKSNEHCMWSWQRALLPLGLIAGGIVCCVIPGVGTAIGVSLITSGAGLAVGTHLKPLNK